MNDEALIAATHMLYAESEAAEEHAAALRTFRRAMRRHEKRARALGFVGVAQNLRDARLDPGTEYPEPFARQAEYHRYVARDGWPFRAKQRQAAFIYERAADAVAKLRGAT